MSEADYRIQNSFIFAMYLASSVFKVEVVMLILSVSSSYSRIESCSTCRPKSCLSYIPADDSFVCSSSTDIDFDWCEEIGQAITNFAARFKSREIMNLWSRLGNKSVMKNDLEVEYQTTHIEARSGPSPLFNVSFSYLVLQGQGGR